jgi:hypothetical protein
MEIANPRVLVSSGKSVELIIIEELCHYLSIEKVDILNVDGIEPPGYRPQKWQSILINSNALLLIINRHGLSNLQTDIIRLLERIQDDGQTIFKPLVIPIFINEPSINIFDLLPQSIRHFQSISVDTSKFHVNETQLRELAVIIRNMALKTEPNSNSRTDESILEPVGKLASSTDIVIAWDPDLVTADEYAELIEALGDLVRAEGGIGIERIRSKGFGLPCESGVVL